MNNKHIFFLTCWFFSPLFLFRPSKAGGDQKVSLHLSDSPSSPQRGHSGWFGMVCCAVTVKFKLNCYSQFFVSLCVLQFHLNHLPCQALRVHALCISKASAGCKISSLLGSCRWCIWNFPHSPWYQINTDALSLWSRPASWSNWTVFRKAAGTWHCSILIVVYFLAAVHAQYSKRKSH